MEGSEIEAIFDALNLNPQLFINEALNTVDDLVNEAFDFYLQRASTLLKTEGTGRSEDLRKGVDYIQNMIQLALDKRLGMWEKYCLHHCFSVPEGFSLPKSDEAPGDNLISQDVLHHADLDAQLESLRDKVTVVAKESAELNRECQALERQFTSSNHCAGLVNEAIKMYEQKSVNDMFQEMVRTASELRVKMDKLKTRRTEERERQKRERYCNPNRDLSVKNDGKDLSTAELEDLQEFLAELRKI